MKNRPDKRKVGGGGRLSKKDPDLSYKVRTRVINTHFLGWP